MREGRTQYQKLLDERYGGLPLSKPERSLLYGLSTAPGLYGYEGEVMEWALAHPDATLQELAEFDFSFFEPIEIVDDEED